MCLKGAKILSTSLFLALLACFVLIPSNNVVIQVQASDDSSGSSFSNTTSYDNPEFSIRLDAPRDWEIVEEKNGFKINKEKDVTYVDLSVNELTFGDLDDYVTDTLNKRRQDRDNFELLQKNEVTVSGNLPGFKVVYTFKSEPDQDNTRKVLRYWSLFQDKVYSIAYVSDIENYDINLPQAQIIIDSLKINAPNNKELEDDAIQNTDVTPMTSNDSDYLNHTLRIENVSNQSTVNQTFPLQLDEQAASGLQTYENSTLGIKILYPSGWNKLENHMDRYSVISFMSHREGPEDRVQERLVLRINSQPTSIELDDYTNRINQTIKENPNLTVTEFKSITLSENPAYRITGILKQADQFLKIEDTWTMQDDIVYRIVFYMEDDKYNEYLSLVNKILDSFVILE